MRIGRAPAVFRGIGETTCPRRHFRGLSPAGKSEVLVVFGEKDARLLDRWVWARDLLEPLVRVPAVVLSDRSVPALIVEDLGTVDLLALVRLDARQASRLFWKAAESVAALRKLSPALLGDVNPPLEASLVRRELDVARTEFFGGLLGQKWDSRRRSAWDEWAFRIGEPLDSLPRIACHRDFRAENLIPTANGEIGIVDFQDLRAGPLGFDIATLLFDREASLALPREAVDDILRDYARWLGLGVADLARAVALCRLERAWRALGQHAREIRRGRREVQPLLEVEIGTIASLVGPVPPGYLEMPDFILETLRDTPTAGPGARPRPNHSDDRRRRAGGGGLAARAARPSTRGATKGPA